MLSGEILSRTPLSVAILPPPSLIQLCKAMAAIYLANQQNIDDDDIYLGNLNCFNLFIYFIDERGKIIFYFFVNANNILFPGVILP